MAKGCGKGFTRKIYKPKIAFYLNLEKKLQRAAFKHQINSVRNEFKIERGSCPRQIQRHPKWNAINRMRFSIEILYFKNRKIKKKKIRI